MRRFSLLGIIFILSAANTQKGGVDYGLVTLNGLKFYSSKTEIIARSGKPAVTKSEGECGAFSNEQPGAPY